LTWIKGRHRSVCIHATPCSTSREELLSSGDKPRADARRWRGRMRMNSSTSQALSASGSSVSFVQAKLR
jgi:hypothetical protein